MGNSWTVSLKCCERERFEISLSTAQAGGQNKSVIMDICVGNRLSKVRSRSGPTSF